MKSVVVVGAGTMGAGIAQVAAGHGCETTLVDLNPDVLQRGLDNIRKNLDRSVEKGKLGASERDVIISRITPATRIADVRRGDIAIEAVVENLRVKQDVFRDLAAALSKDVVLATNTSSLPVGLIAEAVGNPERVVGLHFFNPAPLMPLVEVIACKQSAACHVQAAIHLMKDWGKTPVVAKDTPGFIVNRVARGYYLEGLRLLGEGVAGIDEIDNLMRTLGGFKMGPFELMDLVGLDVNLAVSTSVWEQMERHPRFAPHEIQQGLVSKGNLGRKSKRGFYSYESGEHPLPAYPVQRQSFTMNPLLSDVVRTFSDRAGAARTGSTEQYVFARILATILNEAALAFDDGVASADDIDTAMKLGTSYPKGPLEWAREIGPRTIRGLLDELNSTVAQGRYPAAVWFERNA